MFQNSPGSRIHPTALAALTIGVVLASLACGGVDPTGGIASGGGTTTGPDNGVDGGGVPLVQAKSEAGTCVVTVLPTGKTLATFDGDCTMDWFVSESPTQPGSFLVSMLEKVPQLDNQPLPEVPLDPPAKTVLDKGSEVSVDFVGFDTEGRVVALREMFVDVDLDDRRRKAWIFFDGKRRETDYDMASMFSIILCDAYVYEAPEGEGEGSWSKDTGPKKVQLFEGMSTPWCPRAEGLPELARSAHPTGETFPMTDDDWTPPQAFVKFDLEEGSSWNKLKDHPVASGGYWFEGLRLQTPVAVDKGGTWTVLEELKTPGEAVSLRFTDDAMLACTEKQSVLYDTSVGFAKSWSGPAPCPALWPLPKGASERTEGP